MLSISWMKIMTADVEGRSNIATMKWLILFGSALSSEQSRCPWESCETKRGCRSPSRSFAEKSSDEKDSDPVTIEFDENDWLSARKHHRAMFSGCWLHLYGGDYGKNDKTVWFPGVEIKREQEAGGNRVSNGAGVAGGETSRVEQDVKGKPLNMRFFLVLPGFFWMDIPSVEEIDGGFWGFYSP